MRRMNGRLALLLAVGGVAGTTACRKPASPPITAMGAVVFDAQALRSNETGAPVDRKAFLAREAESLQSPALIERARERIKIPRTDAAQNARLLTAVPRDAARIVEVRVHHPDAAVATQLCSALVDAYLLERLDERREALLRRQASLIQRLEGLGADADEAQRSTLQHEVQAIALQLTSDAPDAHVLEPCKAGGSGARDAT